ncbi:probable methyltransferase-like protein 24 isoform X1 [Macrobrachium rosenbergii]|uniref:probable methyltransferase-like protein 24 isoform X1 n=1 Tax=Macrobrachium rosenbergii TaxID=79674 RepID=UPI0034D3B27B
MVIYRRCWKHALLFTTFFSGIYIFHQSAIDTQNGGCMVEEHRAKNCTVPALKSLRQYNSYINNKQADCSKWVELGVMGPYDGRKLICMDSRFNIEPGNCVALSFGINDNWSFEEDLERLGCKVYAFDPTIGLETQKISPNIHFFNLGISNYQGLRKIGMNPVPTDFNFTKEYPVDTYENILKMLGLTDVPIDMIKMDVETSEIEFLQDVLYNTPHLLRNVKQMAVEIHHDVYGDGDVGHTSIQHVFWVLFHHLKCHGFKMYMSRDGGFFREVVWAREADW